MGTSSFISTIISVLVELITARAARSRARGRSGAAALLQAQEAVLVFEVCRLGPFSGLEVVLRRVGVPVEEVFFFEDFLEDQNLSPVDVGEGPVLALQVAEVLRVVWVTRGYSS